MRVPQIIGGVVLFQLVCLGAAAWWMTPPTPFAGIERDPARAPVAGATLPELEQPEVTRRELVEMLKARDFDTLTRIIENRNQRALLDPNEEWELARVIRAFDISDESLTDIFEDWAQANVTAYAPLIASAQHRLALASLSRGADVAKNTTPEQFEGMNEQLVLLAEDLAAALRIEPNLSEAYRLLIEAARSGGSQTDCGLAAQQGLAVMPASYEIRRALAVCRLPRWGGTHTQVQAIASQADAFFVDNPRLAALHGIVEWDLGRLSDADAKLGHYATALNSGDEFLFYWSRARVHTDAERYEEALEDIDNGLKLSPDSPTLLVQRLYALTGLRRNDEVPDIIELVETIDPMNGDLPRFKEWALKVATHDAFQMQKDALSNASVERITEGMKISGGGNAETYYWRGRAYLKGGDHENALADFETAVRLDPAHFESYRNIDYILALRRDWPGIISRWDQYLAIRPDDGKAVFERAGAYLHGGNNDQAMKDAKRACELGVQAACSVARRR